MMSAAVCIEDGGKLALPSAAPPDVYAIGSAKNFGGAFSATLTRLVEANGSCLDSL